MTREKAIFITESFAGLESDMKTALIKEDEETIQYILLRLFRLLQKTENSIEQAIHDEKYYLIKDYASLRLDMQKKLSEWTAELAYKSEIEGNDEQAEKEWLSTLSFHARPDHYLQYAHTILRNKNLFVNKDIEENMKNITSINVSDINACLKRARFAVKNVMKNDGLKEPAGYFLSWIDLMDKEIDKREDLLQALNVPEEEITIEAAMAELNHLIGMADIKRKIKEVSDWVVFTQMRRDKGFKTDDISMHMVFSGNPGTGKTTVARIIAKIYKALGVLKKGHLVEVGRSDLVAEYVGQTAIKTKNKIKEAEHGVLFIDEAYSLTRSGGNDFGLEAIDTLVKEMEDKRKKLVVILAGYPNEMAQFVEANPGLYSRFKYHIDFPDYSIDELMQIHSAFLKDKQYKITEEATVIVRKLLEETMKRKMAQHGNGRMVRNLIEDEILNKASYVVERAAQSLSVDELDLIDETIMRMVETGSMVKSKDCKGLQTL